MFLAESRGRFSKSFDRQGSKKFFCIVNLQNWPGQMCCKKTTIRRGSNRHLCGDVAFSQLLDNARNFFAQIAIIRELNCANSRRGGFYKRTERKRVMN